MTKSEKEEGDKEHSQGFKGRPEAPRSKKKIKTREITHYFNKLEKPQSTNTNLKEVIKP